MKGEKMKLSKKILKSTGTIIPFLYMIMGTFSFGDQSSESFKQLFNSDSVVGINRKCSK